MTIRNLNESTKISDPTLPKDILGSKQFATFVEVLGEGEIEGFPSAAAYTKGTTNYNNAALKDIYLDKTQILKQSANVTSLQDSDYNFKDVEFTPRFGTSNQTFIGGINNIETEFGVGVEVTNSSPVSRTLTSGIDAVRVTIGVPTLQRFNDVGSTSGMDTYVRMEVTDNNGTVTTPVIDDKISGRTSSAYFRDYVLFLTSSSLVHPVTVTVKRNQADSTDPKTFNEF